MNKQTVLVLAIILGSVVLTVLGSVWVVAQGGSGLSGPRLGGRLIGVVEVRGPIVDSDEVVKELHDFLKDDRVEAVVVRVDSPGGAVAPSQEIATEVKRLADEKLVVVSMGNVAASGGYYLAAPATRIVANPGTVTGSIGVISQIPNVTEIADRFGFQMNTIKSGAAKDAGNPFRPFTDEDRAVFQHMVDGIYLQFVRAVAEGRELSEEEVRRVADGRVLSGEEALQAGLVDELGNFNDAIRLAADLAGIEGEPRLVYPKKKRGLSLDAILSEGARAAVSAAVDELQLRLEGRRGDGGVHYLLPGY